MELPIWASTISWACAFAIQGLAYAFIVRYGAKKTRSLMRRILREEMMKRLQPHVSVTVHNTSPENKTAFVVVTQGGRDVFQVFVSSDSPLTFAPGPADPRQYKREGETLQ